MNQFNDLINSILANKVFDNRPPVLIDVGASGEIFHKWALIARKSVCIAFDADDRDFQFGSSENEGYHKMYKFNRIVTATDQKECTFYLTTSPYCSSTLKPDTESLKDWKFASLFHVEKTVQLPTVTLPECLQSIGLDYVDWFKVDSQGIDGDLFLSIPDPIRKNVLAADFEPGIMDAYHGENKFSDLLIMLEKEKYWISSLEVKGTQRLNEKYSKYIKQLHESPCWAGVTSLKVFDGAGLDLRATLLLIVFSLVEDQWGYALEICEKTTLKDEAIKNIHASILSYIEEQEGKSDRSQKLVRRVKNLVKRVIGKA